MYRLSVPVFRIFTLFALMVLAAPVGAQSLPAGDETAVQAVISAQLEAFQRDDGPGAYAFAAPVIRQRFPTPDIFMDMVRQGYQPVYRPQSVEFLESRVIDGSPFQAVRLIGPDGLAVIALYRMEQQADGSWRIAGVQLVRPSESLS